MERSQGVAELLPGEEVAIGGKGALHLVSGWA